MKWNDMFNSTQMPTSEDIKQYIGQGSELWLDLISYLENTYHVSPKNSYSKCAAQPGWNIKFQKSGKSLCTLYPMEGYFIALVVAGAKEETEVEMMLTTLTLYVKDLYNKTSFSCGGRWLMIDVKDKSILEDVKRLISVRVKPKTA
jgi:hypothetical protein